jgi:hypothetical protein
MSAQLSGIRAQRGGTAAQVSRMHAHITKAEARAPECSRSVSASDANVNEKKMFNSPLSARITFEIELALA